jgi:hypothetical protein
LLVHSSDFVLHLCTNRKPTRIWRCCQLAPSATSHAERTPEPASPISGTSRQKFPTPQRIPAYPRISVSVASFPERLKMPGNKPFSAQGRWPPLRIAPRRSAVRIRLAPLRRSPARRRLLCFLNRR